MFFDNFTKFIRSFKKDIDPDYIVFSVDMGEYTDPNVKFSLGLFDYPERLGMDAKLISEPVEVLIAKEWVEENYKTVVEAV